MLTLFTQKGRQQLEPLAVTICSVVMIFASVEVIFESVRRLVGGSFEIDLTAVCILQALPFSYSLLELFSLLSPLLNIRILFF